MSRLSSSQLDWSGRLALTAEHRLHVAGFNQWSLRTDSLSLPAALCLWRSFMPYCGVVGVHADFSPRRVQEQGIGKPERISCCGFLHAHSPFRKVFSCSSSRDEEVGQEQSFRNVTYDRTPAAPLVPRKHGH